MKRPNKIHLYVLGTALGATLGLLAAWSGRVDYPGAWGIGVLLFVAFLLQVSATVFVGRRANSYELYEAMAHSVHCSGSEM